MARPTILIGPPVASMTREAAVEQLKTNPKLPKGAEVEVQQHAGHWIAAFIEKEAAPFGGPSDDSEESPAPKGESSGGGDSDGGEDPSGGGSDDSPSDDGGEDGPPKKKKPGEGGSDAILHQLMQQLDAISQALGIPPVGGGGLGMGPDAADPMGGPPGPGAGGPPPPPHGHAGPPGAGGPPGGPGAPPPQKVMHEKAGPPPPATFASVKEQHPWGHMIGQTRFFTVAEKCGSDSYADVHGELQRLAKSGGFRVARFTPLEGRQGEKAVHAVIETPRAQ